MYLTDAQDSYIRFECSVQEKKKVVVGSQNEYNPCGSYQL